MGHFVVSTAEGLNLERSSEIVHLYSIPNNDKKTSKLQHRVEFYWWEQFRCLEKLGVAVPYGKNILGIVKLDKCYEDQVFVKAHSAYTAA
jgi:hypothetical protein